jgi:hypothetical protein
MKSYILIGVMSFISLNAVACPDLSGSYQTSDGAKRVEIQMSKDSAGNSTLAAGGPSIIIDGQSHAVPDAPVSYVASCTESAVTVRFLQGGNELGSLTYSKTSNGVRVKSVGMEDADESYVKIK